MTGTQDVGPAWGRNTWPGGWGRLLRTGPVCRLLGLVLIAADIPLAAETADAKAPGGFAVESLFPGPGADPAVSNPPPVDVIQRTTVLAQGLRSPDGIAMQADSGGLYVAMEEANAIVRIQPDGSRKVVYDNSTPIFELDDKGNAKKRAGGLRSPEGLALDKDGILYVVEDVPGGRLISFNTRERSWRGSRGNVIPFPVENSRFAWEAVDVGPAGELLIAGSTMESFIQDAGQEGMLGLFWGAVLYRDAEGNWWMPLHLPMVSYSAACFAGDARHAFFAGEVPGFAGCLDLQSHKLSTYHASASFQSPEGICSLPDGTALVAEEGGRIYRLDPFANTVQQVHDTGHGLESIVWDEANQRLLATDDQRGLLLALELKPDVDVQTAPGPEQVIPFEKQFRAVDMIPDQCPDYLARVLQLGGYDPRQPEAELSFPDFARKYSLVAVDADVTLLSHAAPVEDPVVRIQFVIVAPSMIGLLGDELVWSSSGFAAIQKSGKVLKTELVPRDVIHGDLMECRFTPIGGQQIALPMPFSTKVDTDGIASIHFMGMNVMPDYIVMLNTLAPASSFMLVMHPNERPHLYALHLPADRDPSYWVIALERNEPEMWKPLTSPP